MSYKYQNTTYTHPQAENTPWVRGYPPLAYRQHFVSDSSGFVFLRTVTYIKDSEEDREAETFLRAACDKLNQRK